MLFLLLLGVLSPVRSDDPPKTQEPEKKTKKVKVKQMKYLELDTVTISERLPDTLLIQQKMLKMELDSLLEAKKKKIDQ